MSRSLKFVNETFNTNGIEEKDNVPKMTIFRPEKNAEDRESVELQNKSAVIYTHVNGLIHERTIYARDLYNKLDELKNSRATFINLYIQLKDMIEIRIAEEDMGNTFFTENDLHEWALEAIEEFYGHFAKTLFAFKADRVVDEVFYL